ncbi:molybdopterin-dependent oxidoreductase [Elstera sp.]|uniref:molybdopterin-dependent oxidoreductase n=1 Tax=Elstera sp. TaxID=1916664 RepID=UPI0037C07CB9
MPPPPNAPPAGPVLLTIDGKISWSNATNANGAREILLDGAMIDAFPQVSVTTDTWWEPDVHTYRGPLLRDVLAACGADLRQGTFRVRALNDFVTNIPMEDLQRWQVLLARFMDEAPLPRRTKGPLWIMYPRRGEPALERASIRNRWVWQLERITLS